MKSKIFLLGLVVLLLTSCAKHDDIEFRGTVIGYEHCSSYTSYQDLGYLIELEYPDSLGASFYSSAENKTYKHVVVLYQSDRVLHDKNKVEGTFYLEENYSKANCGIHYTDRDLPEGIFTRVEVIN